MLGPTFVMFVATLACFVLLVLVTFSVPFIPVFKFLHSSASGGVDFGVLGFCDASSACKPNQAVFGYRFDPELLNPLSKTLILFPVGAGLTLLSALVLLPLFISRRQPRWPYVAFGMLTTLAFLVTAAGFGLSTWLFTVAKRRFEGEGLDASYGPSTWMALAATALLLLVALNAGCGTCAGGRFGRQARHIAYTY